MEDNDLHDVNPADGLAMYLEERESDLRESTLKSIRSRVGMFVEWCRENDVESLQDLDGMDLHQYRLSTAEGISRRTLACRLSDVRTFLRWGRSVEAVDPELPEWIEVPEADGHDRGPSTPRRLATFSGIFGSTTTLPATT